MWIVLTDHLGLKRHINTVYITDFYFDGDKTIIWLINGAPLEIKDNIVEWICDRLRLCTDAVIRKKE